MWWLPWSSSSMFLRASDALCCPSISVEIALGCVFLPRLEKNSLRCNILWRSQLWWFWLVDGLISEVPYVILHITLYEITLSVNYVSNKPVIGLLVNSCYGKPPVLWALVLFDLSGEVKFMSLVLVCTLWYVYFLKSRTLSSLYYVLRTSVIWWPSLSYNIMSSTACC